VNETLYYMVDLELGLMRNESYKSVESSREISLRFLCTKRYYLYIIQVWSVEKTPNRVPIIV